jgi:hypothetical protein
MSNILFTSVEQKYDSRNRPVFICQDPQGFYVFKPATGFKTKHWPAQDDEALQSCFARQVSCGHQFGFFNPGEAPEVDEDYSLAPVEPVQ